ncbi:hypothetical protein OHA72_35155 [Dactylosporangium sp. NBC_01737]|uniref:hypothetical protein n=1 Tax=Dactylosporangium sp. NBC_01737 TaxID=2975959 RepID=UPI002E0F5A12|nr:hypothetical protein OHA72_35155 [Dactylosporangium sp. NBC_01737]
MTGTLTYTDSVDESWAARAVETISVSVTPDVDNPIVLDLSGTCPRCRDDMADSHWLIAFSGVSGMTRDDAIVAATALRDAGIVAESLLPAEFTVQCRCAVPHPDPLQRTGLRGCGAAWRMRFELTDDDLAGDE